MINRFLLWITRNMPARAIDLAGRPYIERYHAYQRGKLTIVLHRYLGGDGDRFLHDHPHRLSVGIPIIGGYTEERMLGFCPKRGWVSKLMTRSVWRWAILTARDFHRIAFVRPGTWTVFITYDRFKSWGFAHFLNNKLRIVQPYNVSSTRNWHLTAQKGADFRRQRGTE